MSSVQDAEQTRNLSNYKYNLKRKKCFQTYVQKQQNENVSQCTGHLSHSYKCLSFWTPMTLTLTHLFSEIYTFKIYTYWMKQHFSEQQDSCLQKHCTRLNKNYR